MAREVHHQKLGDIKLVAQPMSLSRTPSRMDSAAPERGEHTELILGGLGYSETQIARLRRERRYEEHGWSGENQWMLAASE